ncbi:MAG: YraN family protein [Oscillospiraceae bacterium]|nr:YraN family protein [Oscillospiraceae bacterium]
MNNIDPRKRGKWGEGIARDYLRKNGYHIVATSFRSRFGEIDIIAKQHNYIVFVEVKTRKNANFAHAKEFVGNAKQRKIISTANYWIMKNNTDMQPRFDVIEVYAKDGELTVTPDINHIENAFGI